MSSRPTPLRMTRPHRPDWRRAEFVLTGLAFLGFITVGIKIRTIYAGLPAHPLFIHVPVVLIPLSVLGALACVARPDWFDRYGILLCLCSIVAMSSIFLAMQAGVALLASLRLTGFRLVLVREHEAAAHVLAVAFTLFTACLILTFSAYRISGGWPTGLAIADDILGSRAIYLLLRVGLVVLALVSAYMVYKVGDLGARAVWEGRLHKPI
ncbi:DUF2231 domain-containing protein [Conexibacter sp. S30A1]|uniref:DUF2231 domain-containing protein n=1 Tax=Conexibacter sp. S30A1 TaxID=2937800 RepID=UPI00200EEAE3|nr:DUF2231 domain-containing protein [Conexibacter sp. S30A1]